MTTARYSKGERVEGSKTLRILLLEDSRLDAELAEATLDRGGVACEMTRVQTRAEYVAALEEGGFDLVLSDYALPSFDGLSALAITRESRPDLPFILVSGTLGEETAIEALKEGATDYVLKHRLERLVPAVRRAMREAGERRERKRAEERLRQSEERYRRLADEVVEGIVLSENGEVIDVNKSFVGMFGYEPDEVVGTETTGFVAPEDRAMVTRRVSAGDTDPYETRGLRKDGTTFPVEVRPRHIPYHGRQVRVASLIDLTERKEAEEALAARARQQAAVADLGRYSLTGAGLPAVMDEAVALVARTLDVECCAVFELLPGGGELLLCSGVGWREGLVGEATVDAAPGSQADYTLSSGDPLIVEDLRTETRFEGCALLLEHRAVSGVSVIVQGSKEPLGVLRAYTREERAFTRNDINFLQSVANVLSTATERQRAEELLDEIKESERRRIAADLHDEVLQGIIHALSETQLMQARRGEEADATRKGTELEGVVESLRRSVEGLRAAIFELRLEENLERSIVSSVESLVELNRRMSRKRYEVCLTVEEGFPETIPARPGGDLVRIIQEALSNARRHSGAGNIRVILGIDEGEVRAEVTDDGRGFDAESARGGVGISAMRQRAQDLGGEIEISAGAGTTVRFRGPAERLFEG